MPGKNVVREKRGTGRGTPGTAALRGRSVYHDLGNLNFTFLVSREHYDLDRQLAVIQRALEHLDFVLKSPGEMIF